MNCVECGRFMKWVPFYEDGSKEAGKYQCVADDTSLWFEDGRKEG